MTAPDEGLGDWSPAALEASGHEVLRLIRSHLEQIDRLPVLADIDAAALRRLLDGPLPEQPEPFERILQDTRERIIPHLTHWNHPNFFGYFAISASAPGILAELLTAALNVNAMLWKTSPAASALEQVVLRWLAELCGYDPGADGVLVNGASLATFYALAAAREAAGFDIRRRGMAGRDLPILRVYATEHVHSSIDKAVIALGIGLENLVKIPADEGFRVRADLLEEAVRADLDRGHHPLAVVAVAGTTSTGAVDPLDQVADVSRRYGLWLHLDAAYGGFYNLVPAVRRVVGRFDAADSIVVNPHKTLLAPLEVTALYCRRGGALARAFSLVPEYLRTDRPDGSVDYMDFSLQLGRQFRALKLWWIIRSFGVQGLRARMEAHIALAGHLAARIDADPDFERVGASPYPLVCFRAVPRDLRDGTSTEQLNRLNAALLERINASRQRFLSHTVVEGRHILRVAIGNLRTEQRHVDALWDAVTAALPAARRDAGLA
ncbi:MAG TPA: pyridoxal-dependent decarboxylase [Bacillota bacterium]